jgi:hypothetical protein
MENKNDETVSFMRLHPINEDYPRLSLWIGQEKKSAKGKDFGRWL